jgi:hypothetical protein
MVNRTVEPLFCQGPILHRYELLREPLFSPADVREQYPKKYKDGRKVWLRNIAGAKWYKVAAGRKDSLGKWTYQLKDVDKNDELYNGGEWVAENNLTTAGD